MDANGKMWVFGGYSGSSRLRGVTRGTGGLFLHVCVSTKSTRCPVACRLLVSHVQGLEPSTEPTRDQRGISVVVADVLRAATLQSQSWFTHFCGPA